MRGSTVQSIPHTAPEDRHRDHLLERLHNLRTVVPVFAQELAAARRQAARLRIENQRLVAEVRRLQRTRRNEPARATDAARREPVARS